MPTTNLKKAPPPRPKSKIVVVQQPIGVPTLEPADSSSQGPPPAPVAGKQQPPKAAGAKPQTGAAPVQPVPPAVMLAMVTVAFGTIGELLGAEPTKVEIEMISDAAIVVAAKYGDNWKYAPEAMLAIAVVMTTTRMWSAGREAKAEQKARDEELKAA